MTVTITNTRTFTLTARVNRRIVTVACADGAWEARISPRIKAFLPAGRPLAVTKGLPR